MSEADNDIAEFGIQPHYFYRKTQHETLKIIGLGPTQTDVAIRSGDLPPPLHLTESGRGSGWYGFQLIQMVRQRLALAQQRAAERRAGSAEYQAAKPKPTIKKKKKR